MKITSTGFGCTQKQEIYFDTIMFVHYKQVRNLFSLEEEKIIVNKVSIYDSNLKIAQFFKDIAKIMKTKSMRESYRSEDEHYQFALSSKDYDFFPVKWFTLWLDNGDKIDHDIAFSVTLIRKNDVPIPFGKFSFSRWSEFPVYRELNVKRNAFK